MKYLRWLLAVALLLYALMSAAPAGFTVLHKLRLLALPEMIKSHGALMDAMSWPWVLVLWVVVVLYLAAAWRLAFRRGRAFPVFLAAFVMDVLSWLRMQGPVYDAIFPPGQRQSDLIVIGIIAVIGALIAWVEMRKAPVN